MEIRLNGKTREVEDGITIRRLLDSLSLPSFRVAVEVNEEIVKRDRYSEQTLEPDDAVEILTFASGG
jgi:sulfur carrier protein